MNNFYQSQHPPSQLEAIDSSLSMLKQLQIKLKRGTYQLHTNNPDQLQSKIPTNHNRNKTEPYSFTQRNMNIQDTKSRQKYIPIKLDTALIGPQSNSQPTMLQYNQNDHQSIKSVIKQNRKLKKYVNCLLQMNQYLKNQLLKKDEMIGVKKMGHSFEMEVMRMEIQYLKELNKDKELQIKKNMYIQSQKKRKSKEKRYTSSFHDFKQKRDHLNSISDYDLQENANYSCKKVNDLDEYISSHRILKSLDIKKNFDRNKQKKTKQKFKTICVKQKSKTKDDSFTKKKGSRLQKDIKCRLCYS